MTYWKLTNKCSSKVRLAVTVGPAQSVGIILNPGYSVICNPQKTPSMDAQVRRNFLDLETDFDNDMYGLELGKVYSQEELDSKKMEKSSQNASQYIDKK
jgi:hypothetical protein